MMAARGVLQRAGRRVARRPARALGGFTLIELMVAVAVVAVLAVVALPSYTAYVTRAKRAQAKTALLQAAQSMERVYSQSGCYGFTDANSCVKGAAVPPGQAVAVPGTSATDYSLAFQGAVTQSYTLVATPCGAGTACTSGSTFTDPTCGALTVDNTGAKAALGVSTSLTTANATGATLAAIQQCWDR